MLMVHFVHFLWVVVIPEGISGIDFRGLVREGKGDGKAGVACCTLKLRKSGSVPPNPL